MCGCAAALMMPIEEALRFTPGRGLLLDGVDVPDRERRWCLACAAAVESEGWAAAAAAAEAWACLLSLLRPFPTEVFLVPKRPWPTTCLCGLWVGGRCEGGSEGDCERADEVEDWRASSGGRFGWDCESCEEGICLFKKAGKPGVGCVSCFPCGAAHLGFSLDAGWEVQGTVKEMAHCRSEDE